MQRGRLLSRVVTLLSPSELAELAPATARGLTVRVPSDDEDASLDDEFQFEDDDSDGDDGGSDDSDDSYESDDDVCDDDDDL